MLREVLLVVAVSVAASFTVGPCVDNDGSLVTLGEVVQRNNYQYTCIEEGGVFFLKPTGCLYEGVIYGPGETVSNEYYVYTCVETPNGVGLEVTGCKGESGDVATGGMVEIGDFVYECARTSGGVTLKPAGCIYNGAVIPIGEIYDGDSFFHSCNSDGGSIFTTCEGCLDTNGNRVQSGETYFKNGFVFKCLCNDKDGGRSECKHKVAGCAEIQPDGVQKPRYVGEQWLEGTAPFRYYVKCELCSQGTSMARTIGKCRTGDTYIKPGCVRRIGGKVFACGINNRQTLQLYTGTNEGKFLKEGYKKY
jgi:hypothetical protein